MLFQDYHLEQIRAGDKTATRREWDRRRAVPGSVHTATTELFVPREEAECFILIEDVYQQPLGDMTDADARREGRYDDVEDFREGYERVYGEGAWDPAKAVWVVEFEHVGREPP